MHSHIPLPVAGGPGVYAESVDGMADEIGKALVVKDINAAPLFRMSLSHMGEWRITPLSEAIIVQVRKVAIRV